MENFLQEWSNKFKRFLILLLLFTIIGLVCVVAACVFLITNGKHGIEVYQIIAFILLIIIFGIVVFIACIFEYLETPDDFDKQIKLKELELEWEKIKKKE